MRPVVPVIGLLVLAGIGILDEITQPLVNRIASVGTTLPMWSASLLAC